MISGVVSLDIRRGMGYRGSLLIQLKKDMAWFRRLTTECPPGEFPPAVIMGRKTWDSLPSKYRPLPRRRNFVLTQTLSDTAGNYGDRPGVIFGSIWSDLLHQAQNPPQEMGGTGHIVKKARVFVIGGGEIFSLALPDIQTLYVTEFKKEFPADTFFPPFRDDFPIREVLEQGEEAGIDYEIIKYRRYQSDLEDPTYIPHRKAVSGYTYTTHESTSAE